MEHTCCVCRVFSSILEKILKFKIEYVSTFLCSEGVTVWKVSTYGVFSGPYFPVLGLNTVKYGPKKTPYLNTFYILAVLKILQILQEKTSDSVTFSKSHLTNWLKKDSMAVIFLWILGKVAEHFFTERFVNIQNVSLCTIL